MRATILALALILSLVAPVSAQSVPAAGVPAASAACDSRRANLGGIGQATVVAFTGAVFGGRVCAIVANMAIDAFTARVANATDASAASDALVTATLGEGGAVNLPLEGATISGIGPYVIEPGGKFPSFGGDIAPQPRVVLAFAGPRVVIIGMSAVPLTDVALVLRDQPDLFGADAVERAVVLSSGPDAAVSLHTADGTLGTIGAGAHRLAHFVKRG